MLVKRLSGESGYSLVEVMASIIILSIAIIPMVGMFDMGLNSATRGSNYDKARALANLKLEEAKSLPFDEVENNFPQAGDTTPYDEETWLTEPGDEFANFQYNIEKQYVVQPSPAPTSPSEDFDTSATATDLIRVIVRVRWPDGTTYSTFGLVAR